MTETLFALGVGEKVVGVCTFCDYPAQALRIEKIGSFLSPNIEAVVARAPDVVIGMPSPNNRRAVEELQRLGVRVVIVEANTLAEIYAAMRVIAAEAGCPEAGEKLIQEVRSRMEAVKRRLAGAPPRRVLMVVGHDPFVAVGQGAFIDELITMAEGRNIAAEVRAPWPHLSVEYVVARAPEVIIDGAMGSEEKGQERVLQFWKDFPSLPAVQEGRVYGYASHRILRPGPRIVEGFTDVARFIHPERF